MSRIVAAGTFPLSGDEAYYWEWSRRLAFGYIDHPPMVAWLIALFDRGARNAGAIRAGFVLCGTLASLAGFDVVRQATASTRAAVFAALLIALAPISSVVFTLATPDAPYLLAWAASLAFAMRAVRTGRTLWWCALGAALGLALLARIFGVGLVAGIGLALLSMSRRHTIDARGPLLAAAIAALAIVPTIAWNATHHWASIEFALVNRHQFHRFSLFRGLGTIAFALFLGAFFALPYAVRALREPAGDADARDVAVWSALPLAVLLAVLSFFEPVEVYWFAGPLISLMVLIAIEAHRSRWMWAALAPAALVSLAAVWLGCSPVQTVTAVFERLPWHPSPASVLEIYTDRVVAQTMAGRFPDLAVVTDQYGLSSLMDYYAGIPPTVVGYNTQGASAKTWPAPAHVSGAVYLDAIPITKRPEMLKLLRRGCGAVELMQPIRVVEDGVPLHVFSLTRCRRFSPYTIAVLNTPIRKHNARH